MAYERLTSRAILGMFYKGLAEIAPPAWVAAVSFLNDESDQFREEYRWLGQNPSFRQWIGGRQAVQLADHGVIVENKEFEATLEFHRRELRRDKTGEIQRRINTLLQATEGRHWQQLLTPLFINGAGSVAAYGSESTYDGANFFGSGHRGGQDNTLTISSVASNRPTAAQAEEGLMQAVERIMGFLDERDQPCNEGASGFLVMCPPNVLHPIAAALNLQVIQGTGGTRDNVLRATGASMGFTWDIAANARLLTASGWGTGSTRKVAVCRTDSPAKAFIRQEAEGPRVSALAEGSEFEHTHNSHQYGVAAERGAGYGLWEHAVEVTFAA